MRMRDFNLEKFLEGIADEIKEGLATMEKAQVRF